MQIPSDKVGWADGVRSDLKLWLDEHWNPELSVKDWWNTVAMAGWVAPSFPEDSFGRGLQLGAARVINEEFTRYGALAPPGGLGVHLAAPTILTCGTPEQIIKYAIPTLNGSRAWCQLFSEPDFGSDLAGLMTRAELDGDVWIINGQKVWSSHAMEANYGMLLARTNLDVPKHKGISWFVLDLEQPGVEIRPLRQMTGHAEFNEVFFTDAVCLSDSLIGGPGNGWAVAQATLQFERTGTGPGGSFSSFPHAGTKGGLLSLPSAGLAARVPPGLAEYGPAGTGAITLPELIELAREYGRAEDPFVRDKIAKLAAYIKAGEWTALRARDTRDRVERQRLATLARIAQTRIYKLAPQIALDIVGPPGLLWAPEGPRNGRYSELLTLSTAQSIGGGTDQIQRNIIAERALGLPREEDPGRTTPYREVLNRRDKC